MKAGQRQGFERRRRCRLQRQRIRRAEKTARPAMMGPRKSCQPWVMQIPMITRSRIIQENREKQQGKAAEKVARKKDRIAVKI